MWGSQQSPCSSAPPCSPQPGLEFCQDSPETGHRSVTGLAGPFLDYLLHITPMFDKLSCPLSGPLVGLIFVSTAHEPEHCRSPGSVGAVFSHQSLPLPVST